MIIGMFVEKQFGSKWYVGEIVDTDIDVHTNCTIWKVNYDDGDTEDCSIPEIRNILCTDMQALR